MERRPPVRRRVLCYEKSRAGELFHLDLKYLPALDDSQPEYEFAAVDDFSREAVARITAQRSAAAATAFLKRAVESFPYRSRGGDDRQRRARPRGPDTGRV